MARFRVVLVDDVAELRRLIRHVLEWSGQFEVVGEADNGEDAVQLASEQRPDLMLLDISMPHMDGMEALPRIRGASPDTEVVMLSGFEGERLRATSLELGARAYIEKGVAPATLISRLLEIFGVTDTDPDLSDEAAPEAAPEGLLDVSSEEMMALVAHEVRNPLAVIQGFGMELQNRWEAMPDEVRRDAVRRMTERARFLNTVVNNLMYMRRLTSDQGWMQPTQEQVRPLLEEIVKELRDTARRHEILIEIDEDLPAVSVDVSRLRQVLSNLIVNAAKFSPADSPIRVAAGRHERGVLVQVIDEGMGIPEDKREEVFEKFRRLEQSGSGIGLGLYISRALMESMGGALWVESGSARGARLACLLPVA